MQELQCTDCILNFLEKETDMYRDKMFELLFDDIHQANTKFILQSLLSYAITLESAKTIDCIARWISINIGNEIIQNIIDQLIFEHFLLVNENEPYPTKNLINLANISPLFASLFMAIILDMLPNNVITKPNKCLQVLFNLFEIWIEKNPLLPLLAYKTNLNHASSYMLNPLPGFIYILVIYPLKIAFECFDSHYKLNQKQKKKIEFENFLKILTFADKQKNACKSNAENAQNLVEKVNMITLKFVRNLSNLRESTPDALKSAEAFKILNLKNLEFICKRLDEFNQVLINYSQIINSQNYNPNFFCFNDLKQLSQIKDDALDNLAQILELCWKCGLTSCQRSDARNIFARHLTQNNELLYAVLNS